MMSGGKRRIAVIGGLPSSLLNFRGEMLRAFVARGHSVLAIAGAEDPAVRDRLAAIGVRYAAVPLRRSAIDPIGDVATLAALRRILVHERPDVLLAYTIKPVVYGHLAARAAGVPQRFALITGAGYAFGGRSVRQRLTGWVASRLYRAALSGAHGVIFQNEDDRALFRERRMVHPETPTYRVAGSGVDLEAFPQSELPAGPPVFLMIARLLRDKGVREFCEAARAVRRDHPEVRFRLIGAPDPGPNGLTEKDLAPWIEDGSIEYPGRADDVRPALAACSVYVLPSFREGMPRTVLEAMATGRPIVTTDAPGCRETVTPGRNGFLVPVADAEALAARVRDCLIGGRKEVERMGRESRRIAEERFDVHRVNEDILAAMEL